MSPKISVRLPRTQHERLLAMAMESDQAISDLIRELIGRALAADRAERQPPDEQAA